MRAILCGTVMLAALVAPAAQAAEPKIEAQVRVIHMTNEGNSVDPALASLMDTFKKGRIPFTSFKLLTSQQVMLEQAKPVEITLPNNRKAKLTLASVKDGTARVTASIENGPDVTYNLGREGSLLVDAGPLEKGQLLMVLSPTTAAPAPKPK